MDAYTGGDMTSSETEYTFHEKRMLTALYDGLWHHREELHMLLDDVYSQRYNALRNMISRINKKLRPKGQEIVCIFANRRTGYRLMRHVCPSSSE
jgi:DNA-binding response OmpR family regulator